MAHGSRWPVGREAWATEECNVPHSEKIESWNGPGGDCERLHGIAGRGTGVVCPDEGIRPWLGRRRSC